MRLESGCTRCRSMARLKVTRSIAGVGSLPEQECPGRFVERKDKGGIVSLLLRRAAAPFPVRYPGFVSAAPRPAVGTPPPLSRRLKNSGLNLRRAASTPLLCSFLSFLPSDGCNSFSASRDGIPNPNLGLKMELISEAPTLLVMKIRAWEKSTRRLSPRVRVPLSKMPNSRFHKGVTGFLDLVKQHETQGNVLCVVLAEDLLAEHGVCFPVPQVTRR